MDIGNSSLYFKLEYRLEYCDKYFWPADDQGRPLSGDPGPRAVTELNDYGITGITAQYVGAIPHLQNNDQNQLAEQVGTVNRLISIEAAEIKFSVLHHPRLQFLEVVHHQLLGFGKYRHVAVVNLVPLQHVLYQCPAAGRHQLPLRHAEVGFNDCLLRLVQPPIRCNCSLGRMHSCNWLGWHRPSRFAF